MPKKKFIVFFLPLLLLPCFYLMLNHDSLFPKSGKEPYAVSVICRGQSTEDLSAIKSGIDKAADELNVDISLITLSKDNDAAQQRSLLNREVANGADAVIILPVDSLDMVQPIREADKQIPVIVMQSGLSGLHSVKTVSCDLERLGRDLAEKIMKTEKHGLDVVIVKEEEEPELSTGLKKVFKDAGMKISFMNLNGGQADSYHVAKDALDGRKGKIWVALDTESLETLGKAKKDLQKSDIPIESPLYGVGRSNAIVSLLEDGVISAIGVENEYGIGYLGMKMAVDRLNQIQNENIKVNYVISDRSNMYETENEYMLFPFIK